ncbi:HNH endonuclease [Rossellomorea sp. AcN35-11]|nr:HNH endonuclease [Rossellomorea aquimaris]WJV29874.1 HNH endonuclease [Rossellomorea sp. AcN35-11]
MSSVFRMPVPVKINGRSSSITNSFINGLIPCIHPTDGEVSEVLSMLGMKDGVVCAYCGDRHTEWDHFRPLVQNKRPTGYISEIHNLVPACGKCNQSKGNSYWREWILSSAKLSPYTRGIKNITDIIGRLDAFEKWSTPTKVEFEAIIDEDTWEEHWRNCDQIHQLMRESQLLSDKIKLEVQRKVVNPFIEHTIYTDQVERVESPYDKKVGVLAKTILKTILESNSVSEEEIQQFTTQSYSKKMFNLGFPLLKQLDYSYDLKRQLKDEKGRNRYYASPIRVRGREYYMCSQWYEPSKKHLVKWIELHTREKV